LEVLFVLGFTRRPGTSPGACAILFRLPGKAGALDHKSGNKLCTVQARRMRDQATHEIGACFVRLESGMRTKADVRQRLWIIDSRPGSLESDSTGVEPDSSVIFFLSMICAQRFAFVAEKTSFHFSESGPNHYGLTIR
jgi:hypothetical protein